MPLMVLDERIENRLKAERERTGADRFDEVWEGIYMMAPLADDVHQDLQTQLGAVFTLAVTWSGLGVVRTGTNVSDREIGWTSNYRIPDVAVFLNNTKAVNLGSHWLGGPDFGIEIVSPHDQSRDKLDFYASIGSREVMFVDRDPWALELYRLVNGKLEPFGRSTPADPTSAFTSMVLPLSFRLVVDQPRPRIEIMHHDGKQRWLI
jgi:Uma2 family endonuclease